MTETPPPDNSLQICPKCKSPIIRGTKFCESCGAKIDALPACAHCGAPNVNGTKFCESCGSPLVEIPQENQSAAPVDVIAPLPPQPAEYIPPMSEAQENVTGSLLSESTPMENPILPPGEEVPKKPEENGTLEMQPAPYPDSEKIQDITKPQQPPQSSKVPDSKKPFQPMTLAIIGIVILIVLALGAYVIVLPMLPGTGTVQKSGDGTPVSTLPAASSPTGSVQGTVPVTGTLTPGQTQVPPANLALNFQAERDSLSGIVTVTFRGGAGQNGVKDVLFRLTRSDGQVLQKSFTLTQIDKSESLQGTKMTDRVEVIATYYTGEQYKILDQIFEYKKR
jgi:hypothetical protein